MNPIGRFLLTAVLMVGAGQIHADTLVIPLGQQASGSETRLPERGQSKAAVAQRYGDPVQEHAPVGQPPITRWEYPDFSVYFEQDHVIHSVSQHRPKGN